MSGVETSPVVHTKDLCPICLLMAETAPCADGTISVTCEGCGTFMMSRSAELCIEDHLGPIDRQRLSATVFDVCRMAQPGKPLIDAIAATSLIAISAL